MSSIQAFCPRRVVASVSRVEAELAELRAEVRRLRAENERLAAVLRLSPSEAGPPGPTQIGGLGSVAGPLSLSSTPAAKVGFFADLFAARRDVYAVRWESARTAKSGWMPAVAGGWRRGMDPRSTTYLPLTAEVVTRHLAGEIDLGLYPLLRTDTCQWLAADFDGASSMLDALAFLKAARSHRVPAALEVSRSGLGAHVWTFFTAPVPASVARRLGIGLLREAMGVRGRLSLSSYDRLFPSQDVLPVGGFGNLIAAPLQGRCRRSGTTVFLDLATMEPHEDQWAYLSSLDRMTPRELTRAVARVGEPVVGVGVSGAITTRATRIQVPAPPVVRVTVGSRVTVSAQDLTPAMASTLMHAASLRNPAFDERQRLRRSTWDPPATCIPTTRHSRGTWSCLEVCSRWWSR